MTAKYCFFCVKPKYWFFPAPPKKHQLKLKSEEGQFCLNFLSKWQKGKVGQPWSVYKGNPCLSKYSEVGVSRAAPELELSGRDTES